MAPKMVFYVFQNLFIRKIAIISLLVLMILLETNCRPYRCPANGGSYKDKDPDAIFKARRHKPQSGLWPKNMR